VVFSPLLSCRFLATKIAFTGKKADKIISYCRFFAQYKLKFIFPHHANPLFTGDGIFNLSWHTFCNIVVKKIIKISKPKLVNISKRKHQTYLK
jgi:hypothetical protein